MKRKSAIALGITAAAFTLLITQFAPAQAAPSKDHSSVAMQYPTQGLSQSTPSNWIDQAKSAKESASAPVIHSEGHDISFADEYAGYWNNQPSDNQASQTHRRTKKEVSQTSGY
jgi:hypothetical protein